MKRTLSVILIAVLVLSLAPLSAFGADKITVTLEGKTIEFPDAQPFVDSNFRTLSPLSAIAGAMGLSVTWDGDKEIAAFTREYTEDTTFKINEADKTHKETYFVGRETLAFTIGSKDAVYTVYWFDTADKEKKTVLESKTYTKTVAMDTAAIVKDQRTYAPVKYLAETMGLDVSWDEATSTVGLTKNESAYSILTWNLLGNREDQIALGFYKGGVFDLAGTASVKVNSAKVNDKAAVIEKFSEEDLNILKEESYGFDLYLDGCYVKAPFSTEKENTIVFNVTFTYANGTTAVRDLTLTYTPNGYGGIL